MRKFFSWIDRRCKQRKPAPRPAARPQRQLKVETLEDRTVPVVNVNLTGITGAFIDVNGVGTGSVIAPGKFQVDYSTNTDVRVVGGDVELFLNLDSIVAGSFNGAAGADGITDFTLFQLDPTGQNLEVHFNGLLALSINVNSVRSLSIFGSLDDD
jgi:hypothetical protein